MARKTHDDEYVANLMKQDARKAAKTYELVGIGAFNPKRLSSGAPQANAGFLRHIIRQTDSHNAALLAKEAREARARLESLNRGNVMTRRNEEYQQQRKADGRLTPVPMTSGNNNTSKVNSRALHERDIHEHRRERKWKKEDRDDLVDAWSKPHRESSKDRRKARDSSRDGRKARDSSRDRRMGRDISRDGQRAKRKSEGSDGDRHAKKRKRSYSPHDRDRRHKRSRDEEDTRHSKRDRTRCRQTRRRSYSRSTARSRSRSRSRSRTPLSDRRRKDQRHRNHSHSPRPKTDSYRQKRDSSHSIKRPRPSKRRSSTAGSDSDPLEAIVGPLPASALPAVRSRGRGTHKANVMGIESRFSSIYDPAIDVHTNSDAEDDWGDALEAVRDRAKWQQQGADRLKTAGFSAEQIKRWEKGDRLDETDVTWVMKGQAREWDQGKVFDAKGNVTLQADFGRLK